MREVLPAIAFGLDEIKDGELAEANRFFSRGKFVESLAGFRGIIQKLLLVVAKDESEATDVSLFLHFFISSSHSYAIFGFLYLYRHLSVPVPFR